MIFTIDEIDYLLDKIEEYNNWEEWILMEELLERYLHKLKIRLYGENYEND